jgi:hypothetical protein
MKRSPLEIDNKVLAGLIVGAITYALTKLAIPLDAQLEQGINVAAALLAAYLVPSKVPSALTSETDEIDDVSDPPTLGEVAALHSEIAQYTAAPAQPAVNGNGNGNGNGGGTATLIAPYEVDEAARYGERNLTGMSDADVADQFDSAPLDED